VLSRFKFRPTLVPTLFTMPALVLMIGLSIWQVDRLQWKTALIAERHARITAAAIPLPPEGSDPAEFEFRRVAFAGTFLHDKEMLLVARSMNGNVGYQVVTPFMLSENRGAILVNRGWIPANRKDPSRRMEGQIQGPVSLEGVVRLPRERYWMEPENEPQKNAWFYINIGEMATAAQIVLRRDLYVDAGPAENPGGYPIGGQSRVDLPNDHLQYAITWALLAVILAVIYVAYHLKLERERKAKT